MTARKLHIVVVSRIYAPEPAAASFRLEAMVNALATAGHGVTVLTTRPRPGSAAAAPAGEPAGPGPGRGPARAGRVNARRAPVLRNRDGYVRGYLQYMSFDLPVALRLLFTARPDVVVVEPPPTTGAVVRMVSRLRRVPYVYYAADLWSDAVVGDSGPSTVSRVLARLEGWAMRAASGVLAVLPSVAERVHALTGRPAKGPGALDVRVVGHGIDTRVFHPQPGAAPPPGAPSRFLLYSGSTSTWHGADIFIRALARAEDPDLADLNLVYLGHGSCWPDLQELAEQLLPGRVHFLPMAPPEQAAAWLRAAQAAVVSLKPGQNYDLAFPTKLYAAAACGTPVIFAGVGPAIDAVNAGNLGLAVNYDDAAVAAAIPAVLARDRASTHSAQWVAQHASLTANGALAAQHVQNWARPATRNTRPLQ